MGIVKLNAKAAEVAKAKIAEVSQAKTASPLGALIDDLQVATAGNEDVFEADILVAAETKGTKHIIAQLGRKNMKGVITSEVENADGSRTVKFTATSMTDAEKAAKVEAKAIKAAAAAVKA